MSRFTPLLLIPFLLSLVFEKISTDGVSIHELVLTGQVVCIPQTNGGYNKSSITLKLMNRGKGQRVLIPLGTRFKSAVDEEQDLIVPQDLIVDLPRDGEKEITLDAYCVQQSNLSPDPGQTFVLSQETDDKLLRVLNFMKGNSYDTDVIQNAIWAITDRDNVAGIHMQNDQEKSLREFICEITGQENVWYDLDRNYEETSSREIIPVTKEVSGNIAYEVNQTGKVVLQVTEEDGSVIRELGEGMPVTRVGSYKFRFSMKVQGWNEGTYFVQLKLGDNVFHKVAFEV